MTQRIVYETHMHTPLCRHAEGEPERYAEVAEQRGLRGIIVTCHNPMPDAGFGGPNIRMNEDEVDTYLAIIERARDAFDGRVEVHAGLECDYFPGFEHVVEQQTRDLPLNFVLGSVHPQLMNWRRKFALFSPIDAQFTYFNQLADAAETGLFDSIAHPDLIKNVTANYYNLDNLIDHIRATLDRIAKTGAAMELNTSGLNKVVPEMNPSPRILAEMKRRDIPVTVGADAHVPDRVADHYEEAYDLLEAAGYTHVSYFLERRRHDIAIADARASLTNAAGV
ncbi:MAG: histidinol-phosphatase HisJ family protein [Phycisphaera sp.]|nr:histidinol-phosphatase HisJ family protein [Phycisphaera sp.]